MKNASEFITCFTILFVWAEWIGGRDIKCRGGLDHYNTGYISSLFLFSFRIKTIRL